MRRTTTGWLLALAGVFSVAPAHSTEYLPPNVEVIVPPPFEYLETVLWVARSDSHLAVGWTSSGGDCQYIGVGFCPALLIYERVAESWELQQSFEYAEPGLLNSPPKFVAPDRLLVGRFWDTRSDFETIEYRLDAATNTWEASAPVPVFRSFPYTAFHDGVYVSLSRSGARFIENVDGAWQETGVTNFDTVHGTGDDREILQVIARDNIVYVLFCSSPRTCNANYAVATLDFETRSFVEAFEIAGNGASRFAVFENHIVFSWRAGIFDPVEAPVVYERIGGAWQPAGEAIMHFDWRLYNGALHKTGNTLFEMREPMINSDIARALLFYEPNPMGQWEQQGAVIVPDGERLMLGLDVAAVYGDNVYLLAGPGGAWTRVFEIRDYREYLDLDRDVMPQWWEEQYGFSPTAFNDFSRDHDLDGLSSSEEYGYQTSPTSNDTDADRMPDRWELNHFLDPRDAADGDGDLDLDGVSNRQEFLIGTDPTLPNSGMPSNIPTGSGGGGLAVDLILLGLLMAVSRRKRLPAVEMRGHQ